MSFVVVLNLFFLGALITKAEQVPRCPEIMTANGEVTYIGDRERYTYAKITCNEGYSVGKDGLETVLCLQSLQWESTLHCYKRCFQKDLRLSSRMIIHQKRKYVEHGQSVHLSCKDGYEHSLASDPDFVCSSGKLRGTKPHCIPKPCDTPTIQNGILRSGYLNRNNYSRATIMSGRMVAVSCEEDFFLYDNSKNEFIKERSLFIKCSLGNIKTIPSCRKKSCEFPDDSYASYYVNGEKYIGNTISHEEKVRVVCEYGTSITVSSDVRTCWNGAWKSGEEFPVCEPALCDGGCQNGGTCTSPDKCTCPFGFSGNRCQTALCDGGCQNSGTCTSQNRCRCPDEFSGSHCETALCYGGCQNGGTCTSPNRCRCPDGFSGSHCETEKCRAPIDNGNDAFFQNGATYTVTHESCSGRNVPSFKGQITCENGNWSEQINCLPGASYNITVKTANIWFAGTDGEVYLYMYGSNGNSGKIILHGMFEAGDEDLTVGQFADVGEISKIRLGVNALSSKYEGWKPESVQIEDDSKGVYYTFKHDLTEIDNTSITLYPVGTWYRIIVKTVDYKDDPWAGTKQNVSVKIQGSKAESDWKQIRGEFQPGRITEQKLYMANIGQIEKLHLKAFGKDNLREKWKPDYVTIHVENTDELYVFRYKSSAYLFKNETTLSPEEKFSGGKANILGWRSDFPGLDGSKYDCLNNCAHDPECKQMFFMAFHNRCNLLYKVYQTVDKTSDASWVSYVYTRISLR